MRKIKGALTVTPNSIEETYMQTHDWLGKAQIPSPDPRIPFARSAVDLIRSPDPLQCWMQINVIWCHQLLLLCDDIVF